MKIRRTVQEVKDIIEKYNKSGLSKTQFCMEQKISLITFYKLVKKIGLAHELGHLGFKKQPQHFLQKFFLAG